MVQGTMGKPTYSVELTEAAVAKAAQLLAKEPPGLALRVSVQPGGCSGLKYELYFTDEYAKVLVKELAEGDDEAFAEADDEETALQRAAMEKKKESVTWFGRLAVVINEQSGVYLDGATLDFADTLSKSGFTIDNPNAKGTCGCGDSFQ